ncbi:MAG: methyltransferase domain-containing protein [Opitutae bacterium]|jgi:hypothetical protein|nr:methyltransferase domain-containing protein [Opitutae bacterium]MBT6463433.1 methyltransferase domain-containing protein [Opitutae bacterium]MBT7854443.1 methyltransferase domain-containing protein [Opitutae bacterium]
MVEFTAHNIDLGNGLYTISDKNPPIKTHPYLNSSLKLIKEFLKENNQISLVDLGCLEGGYTIEFAKAGINSLGIDVRESNIQACNYCQSIIKLPNLRFVKDDVLNIRNYGKFDVSFCSGLLYHLNKPISFLKDLSHVTNKIVIIQTHFSTTDDSPDLINKYNLSELTENESVPGRWAIEYANQSEHKKREKHRWSSWDNDSSFWIQKEYLIEEIKKSGFELVMEQYDNLHDIAET